MRLRTPSRASRLAARGPSRSELLRSSFGVASEYNRRARQLVRGAVAPLPRPLRTESLVMGTPFFVWGQASRGATRPLAFSRANRAVLVV
nr:MAG TPA: hypothetical protein [Caudoviricetes sp.]